MADNKQHDKDNLIDLASERRRFQNRPNPTGTKKFGNVGSVSKKKTPEKAGPRWYHYLQLILFLAFLAWMMQRCQSGSF
jgi:hypothetical protein